MVCKEVDQVIVIGTRLGWEVSLEAERVCFFPPVEDNEIAEALEKVFNDWDLEENESGEGYTVWTGAWQSATM